MQRFNLVFALVLVAGLVPAVACASLMPATINAQLFGSRAPETAPAGTAVVNGDFLIQTWGGTAGPVGDGIDEQTTWIFDFRADPRLADFHRILDAGGTLRTALVHLKLRMRTVTGQGNDLLEIDGLGPIGGCAACISPTGFFSPVFDLRPGDHDVRFDLLDHYAAGDLLAALAAGLDTLPALYADDAIVYQANLILEAVPEPAPSGLLGLALVVLAVRRRRGPGRGMPLRARGVARS